MGCRGTIGIMWLHVLCSSMFACLLFWYGWWIWNHHNPFVGSQYPSMIYLCFYLLRLCACQRLLYIHRYIIFQFRWDWSEGWEGFMHVFLGLINSAVVSGIGVWMPLWTSWVLSCWLGFLVAPFWGLLFSGHPDSVLCIMSWLLGHLRVFFLGIKYY